jgi:hypothetical protein
MELYILGGLFMKQCPQCNFACEDTDIVCKNCGYLFNAQNFSSPPDGGAYQQPQPPTQQPYQQDQNYLSPGYPGVQGVPMQKNNGMAIASMVLGIIGVVFSCCYGIGVLAAIPGLIFSFISMKKIGKTGEKGKGMAVAGIVCSAVAIIIAIYVIVNLIIFFNSSEGATFWDTFYKAYNNAIQSSSQG